METIISLSLVVTAGLIALSQYFSYAPVAVSERSRFRYMCFTFAIAGSSFISVAMVLTYPGTICFLLYALDKFLKVLIMGEVVLLTQDMVDVDRKYTSLFITLIAYSAVMMFFIDSLMQGGVLQKNIFGVYFNPVAPWHKALYFIYYMFYVVMLITFVVYRGAAVYRKCEKHDLMLLLFVYLFSAAGFIAEQFIITYSMTYIPIVIIFNLIAAVFMRKLLLYHDSISITPAHFEKELDSGRTDVVFILDSQLRIVHQNKRAEVLSQLLNDKYVGNKITDVFKFTPGAYSQICQTGDDSAFGISADYPANDRHVNMIINHKLDNYNEILATVVFVYNMEDIEKTDNLVNDVTEENEEEMIKNAVSITRDARVLIVDEDILFLNVFQRILKPYEVNITRAVSGQDAIDQVTGHVYDIIFVAYEMTKMTGTQLVSRIRSMPGEYYYQVPIVFTTTADINDVFTGFLEAGFNDYLEKPVSKRALNSVLTRWLWQRFGNEDTQDVPAENRFSAQYHELNELINDAEKMFNDGKYQMLGFCVKGIKRDSMILGLTDISDLSTELDEAILFEDKEKIEQVFNKLRAGIRDAITIR
ncbi:MAG: response regulator [Lachnospiraceae bacterium]|nr:response regulator [Lachnospiraceae bacterium]